MRNIKEFEDMIKNAELKALQKMSLEQPLNESQFKRFKELAESKMNSDF